MDTQDDWMVESLSRYDAISMYDLPAPTSCLAWTSSDGKLASKNETCSRRKQCFF